MKNKISKMIAMFLAMTMVVSVCSVPAFAASNILTWHLVDSGKHLDYDGNSEYMSYVVVGASIWNGYKSGVIRKDSLSVIEDVYISDINTVNGSTGITYASGKIELNKYYLKDDDSDHITNTVTHELGHALGLAHSTSSSDIMYESQTAVTKLSQNDKDSYDASYNRY